MKVLGRGFWYRLRGKANHAPADKFNDQDFSNSMFCFSSAIDTDISCRGAPAGIHWHSGEAGIHWHH